MRLAARAREERANKYDGFDMNVREFGFWLLEWGGPIRGSLVE
jgi:hypothetical protein